MYSNKTPIKTSIEGHKHKYDPNKYKSFSSLDEAIGAKSIINTTTSAIQHSTLTASNNKKINFHFIDLSASKLKDNFNKFYLFKKPKVKDTLKSKTNENKENKENVNTNNIKNINNIFQNMQVKTKSNCIIPDNIFSEKNSGNY